MNEYKHEMIFNNKKVSIWHENGQVKQIGIMCWPEVLETFEDNVQGRSLANAYIQGMLRLSDLIRR